MFIFGYFISALARLVDVVLMLYMLIIIARAVMSWINPDPYNGIVQFVYRTAEPSLGAVRRRLPIRDLGVDVSPIIVVLVVMFLRWALVPSLEDLGRLLVP
jgi:YggT family protein